ncbi:MAG: glycoside hydrolase family 1 protein [Candidatus Omnitrophica bacterium]|nr:glycoside hydrolase family 1 protein [Candidatus Omnitrophota bacterium]
MIEFPKDFLWGSTTAAYQVEGDNSNSDWWEWEKTKPGIASSGAACRHYQLFREDFNLAKSLGHNSHRLSLEWARIQPEPDKFSQSEIDHYIQVIDHLRSLGIEPIVTLHHFTNPLWLSKIGGWENPQAIQYFLEYAGKIVKSFSGRVKYWVTVNEPMVYTYYSYLVGEWPPQKKSPVTANKVANNLVDAHIRSYRLIHSFYKENKLSPPMVSIAQNMIAFIACQKSLRNNLAVYLRNRLFNFRLINLLYRKRCLDFIGMNYYTRHLVDTRRWSLWELLGNTCAKKHDTLPKNSLGWEIYPQGLYYLLMGLKKYRLPVFILENGICCQDDNQRWDYIREHLKKVHAAMANGVNVIGYLYWSLLDNFEWDKGFAPRFGLCAIDYSDYKRTPRDSARKLAQVASTGLLEE